MEELDGHKGLLVRKIENGTVIDHIAAWNSELIIKLLRLEKLRNEEHGASVAILQNVASERLGRKDIIKLEGVYIDENTADITCLVEPAATINYIRSWKATKYVPRVPDRIEGRIKCPELQCITNAKREPVTTRFRTSKSNGLLQCEYCDSLLKFERIPEFVK